MLTIAKEHLTLRDALHQRLATVDEIMRAASVCRARTVLEPYVEAVL